MVKHHCTPIHTKKKKKIAHQNTSLFNKKKMPENRPTDSLYKPKASRRFSYYPSTISLLLCFKDRREKYVLLFCLCLFIFKRNLRCFFSSLHLKALLFSVLMWLVVPLSLSSTSVHCSEDLGSIYIYFAPINNKAFYGSFFWEKKLVVHSELDAGFFSLFSLTIYSKVIFREIPAVTGQWW